MRRSVYVFAVAGSILSACNRHDEAAAPGPKSPGRYAGIGTFEAGRLWREMAAAPTSNEPAAASLNDDEHVIVVLDSHTGEVRQCGDHSGYCVAMNPWTAPGATSVPVRLKKHVAEAPADDQASVSLAANATNEAAPAK
jgi:hypothetical protein